MTTSTAHWYIDAATGNDSNDGLSATSPVASTRELFRRLNGGHLTALDTTVHIGSALDEPLACFRVYNAVPGGGVPLLHFKGTKPWPLDGLTGLERQTELSRVMDARELPHVYGTVATADVNIDLAFTFLFLEGPRTFANTNVTFTECLIAAPGRPLGLPGAKRGVLELVRLYNDVRGSQDGWLPAREEKAGKHFCQHSLAWLEAAGFVTNVVTKMDGAWIGKRRQKTTTHAKITKLGRMALSQPKDPWRSAVTLEAYSTLNVNDANGLDAFYYDGAEGKNG